MLLHITVPKPYDFASSVRDHGWIALAPFRWHDDEFAMQRIERLRDGQVVLLTPEQVAAAREDVFQTDIRLGYRNAYILQLARDLAEGRRDLEALKTTTLPVKELKKELKSMMGVGDYAAHTLMMILGRYDE